MKRLSFLLLMAVSVTASAQITTYSTGNVNIKRSTEFTMNILSVGEHYYPGWFSSYQNGIHSKITTASGMHNIALYGDASAPSNVGSGRSVGVLGVAGFSTNGFNYGVLGRLTGSQNGAGVYGSIYDNMGSLVNGRYAGYFNGDTYVNGVLTASSVVTPSDIRLKENIVSISDVEKSTLYNILNMDVIEYNYKKPEISEAEKDTAKVIMDSQIADNLAERHFGLSAQELQKIYPNLVKEGQDGYLRVNYVELVPILIRSIQELNQKIENIEGNVARRATTTGLNNKAVLYQNSSNSANGQTTIRFFLPDNISNAYIAIFDLQGGMKKQYAVNPSQNQINIDSYDLKPGIYLYSLVAGGQEMDTKRLIISK